MSMMVSQITSLLIVYSIFYSGVDQGKHQSSASLAFVWGIHWWPVNSQHKRPVTRKMFPFDNIIMSPENFIKKIIKLWMWYYLFCTWLIISYSFMDSAAHVVYTLYSSCFPNLCLTLRPWLIQRHFLWATVLWVTGWQSRTLNRLAHKSQDKGNSPYLYSHRAQQLLEKFMLLSCIQMFPWSCINPKKEELSE